MCLLAVLIAFAPRVALLGMWLFTPLVTRAFNTFLWPLLGLIFLPLTTIIFVLVWVPGIGVTGWGWLWVILGFMLDVGTYGGGAYGSSSRGASYA